MISDEDAKQLVDEMPRIGEITLVGLPPESSRHALDAFVRFG